MAKSVKVEINECEYNGPAPSRNYAHSVIENGPYLHWLADKLRAEGIPAVVVKFGKIEVTEGVLHKDFKYSTQITNYVWIK